MDKNFLTIAQVSDLHICDNGMNAYEVSDSLSSLNNFIRHINKLPFKVDFLVVTGDLSDDGSISSYRLVKEKLNQLPIPYYIIPGNHDNKKNMALIFDEIPYLKKYVDNRIFYSFISSEKKIILLDSVEEGNPSGSLTDGELDALEEELATNHDTLIFLHHPPFPTGIGFMDNQSYLNRERFLRILNMADNVMFVGCGHIHRVIFTKKGKTDFNVAPSTAMQLDLNLNDNAPGDFVFETPGYLIHRVNLTDNSFPDIATHAVQITDREEMEITYPFND